MQAGYLFFAICKRLTDFFKSGFEFNCLCHVYMLFHVCPELAGFPYLGVEIGVCSQMLWLEVVGPDNKDVILGLGSVLFLGRNVASKGIVLCDAGWSTHLFD